MRKLRVLVFCLMFSGILTGCGAGKEQAEETTMIRVRENGKITSRICESFEKEYYSEEELKNSVTEEVDAYNEKAGADKIKVNEVSVKDGMAKAECVFADGASYGEFNQVRFFFGTVAQAYEAGYSFDDTTLKSASEEGVALEKSGILEKGNARVIILEEPIKVVTYQNIQFASDNVTLLNGKEAQVEKTEDGALAYLLLK